MALRPAIVILCPQQVSRADSQLAFNCDQGALSGTYLGTSKR
jgi:hypothetical protein